MVLAPGAPAPVAGYYLLVFYVMVFYVMVFYGFIGVGFGSWQLITINSVCDTIPDQMTIGTVFVPL